jgi:hypothetical protein
MLKDQPMKNGIPTYMAPSEEAEIKKRYPRIDLDGMYATNGSVLTTRQIKQLAGGK